ncbi:MAG: NAD-dependent epimerase/dehydratase family protein [Nocardioides sp.]|uniref:NAD-dependent epimerase/dehydratase family protein n=1 Tax=Nocardioides sp. TaxID=35761 RepID=UPI003F00F10E
MTVRVALLGASGFVGSEVRTALEPRAEVVVVAAPRLSSTARTSQEVFALAADHEAVAALAEAFDGVDVVVNAAGNPDASSLEEDALFGANALLPAVVVEAAGRAGVRRVVHVSSAVVQNDKPVLDDTEDLRPFSPYSASKVLGEVVVREAVSEVERVRYRPPSVHAPQRRVTRMIRRIATSPAATVAAPGDQLTPQALLPNVAAAVAELAVREGALPAVVHHPSEGVTVTSLMTDLSGGRRPRRIPRALARALVALAKLAGRVHRPTAANARRVELLWLGQEQAPSWLTVQGWSVPVGHEGWRALASEEEQ